MQVPGEKGVFWGFSRDLGRAANDPFLAWASYAELAMTHANSIRVETVRLRHVRNASRRMCAEQKSWQRTCVGYVDASSVLDASDPPKH